MDRLKKYHQQLNIMTYILDDEEDVLGLLEGVFKEHGFDNCRFFTKADELLVNLNEPVHICILDYTFPGGLTGIDVLEKVKEVNPECYFIGFSGLQDYRKIIQWVNAGLRKIVNKNNENYLRELTDFVKEAVKFVKDDFDFHSSIANKIKAYEAKAL